MSPNNRVRYDPPDIELESSLINERVLVLILESLGWDLQTLCSLCLVSRKLRAVAKRILWRQLCLHRAPHMTTTLALSAVAGAAGGSSSVAATSSSSHRILGGWPALAKLLLYCCGCQPSCNFRMDQALTGHFCSSTRFSKTSGRSFLSKWCRDDILYVSDPCEHALPPGESGTITGERDHRMVGEGFDLGDHQQEDLLGVYRGVFGGFLRSKTRAVLLGRQVKLEESVRCPYCRARVWSMTGARMVPKSAWRRLGARHGSKSSLEYFVCVNGHMYGACWLVPLSDDDDDAADLDDDDDIEECQ